MANYVLGPRAARWLQTQMNGHMTGGRNPGGRPCSVDEQSFCHPFELRWAASAGGDSGGAPKGAWIIWLPKGSLVVDGAEVDFSTLTAASGYPAGWYDLTESFGESEVPEEFDLYLQPGAKAEFGIDKSKLTDPVLVASVKGKMVKGVVESALVFSASGRRPFDIEMVESGETSVRKIVRCSFWIMGQYVTLEDYTLPEMAEEEGGENPDVRVVVIFNAPAAGDIDKSNPGQYCSIGTEADLPSGDEAADRVISTLRLYDFTAGGAVKMDWRDVPVRWQFWYVDDNTISVDEDTAKSGQFHLKQFYGNERNLATIPAAGATVSFLVRYANASDGGDLKLCYLSPDGLKDFLGVSEGGGGGGGSSGGDDDDSDAGVISVNGMDGAITLLGGKGIEVTSKGRGYIMISYNADKEEEDEVPGDQCAHPGDEAGGGEAPGGGVPAGGGGVGGGGVAGSGGDYGWDYGGGCSGC